MTMPSTKELDYKITKVIESVSLAVSKITNEDLDNYSTSFKEIGFVQIPAIIDHELFRELLISISEIAEKHFVSYQGIEREYFNRTISGHQFKRLFFKPQTDLDEIAYEKDELWKTMSFRMEQVSRELSDIIRPIMTELCTNFVYKFGSIFCYHEDDYIGLHHDGHSFEIINAQFPLSINTEGCIRIKYKDELIPYYDIPGCLNILDSKTWHDVPIIAKGTAPEKANRMNLTLRYMPS